MIRNLRHRDRAGVLILLGCLTTSLGCSATRGSRFRPAAGAQTSTSVGDQALPPKVGLAGSQVSVDSPEPEPYRNPRARISGRVVDDQGRAVSGASVRLADGSSQVGRDVRTTTDAGGGFTLGGLRPGTGYLLVAEANFGDNQGTITGQAEADTSETGVQIRLGAATSPRKSRGKSPTAQPISERTVKNPEAASGGTNVEDLGPPAEAADAVDGDLPPPAKSRRDRPTKPKSSTTSGWRRPGAPPDSDPASDAQVTPASDRSDDSSDLDPGAGSKPARPQRPVRSAGDSSASSDDDADDVNPLPPALPVRKSPRNVTAAAATASRATARTLPRARVVPRATDPVAEEEATPGQLALGAEAAAVVAEAQPESAAEPGSTADAAGLMAMPSLASVAEMAATPPAAEPAALNLGAANPAPESPPPGQPDLNTTPQLADSSTTTPATSAPGDPVSATPPARSDATPTSAELVDPSAGYNPFALVAATPIEPTASSTRATIEPTSSTEPTADQGSAPTPAAKPKKWGDMPALGSAVAAGAVVGASAATAGKAARVGSTAANRPTSFFARRTKPAAPAKPDAAPLCQFDSRSNQLIDFQLPDLDGQPVRFRDFDADYVLLDFWGTWCDKCVDSVPQLVGLQKKYGPNKLKVVGIACEKTAPEKRAGVVAAAAERLGINYAVLVTSLDGDCPVQRDLRVRVYPTMILLDRRGNVLLTAEGSTESNWFRIDRAILAAERTKQTARR